MLLAGIAVSLLVLCYAQAASYFDQAGGSYLYAREAFGRFAGRGGLDAAADPRGQCRRAQQRPGDAVTHFWPAAGEGSGRVLIVVGSLAALTWVNVIGVRAGAGRRGAGDRQFVPLPRFGLMRVVRGHEPGLTAGGGRDPHE
ncbi:hypothetical protein [Rhodanobacter lindaniclasticus]